MRHISLVLLTLLGVALAEQDSQIYRKLGDWTPKPMLKDSIVNLDTLAQNYFHQFCESIGRNADCYEYVNLYNTGKYAENYPTRRIYSLGGGEMHYEVYNVIEKDNHLYLT